MRRFCKSALLSFAACVLAAGSASAQSGKIEPLTHFSRPTFPVTDGVVELPDGRLYGMIFGGDGAGIYEITPAGNGGYTSTLVHPFAFAEPQPLLGFGFNAVNLGLPNAFALREAVGAADGKVYYLFNGALMRFDPETNTTNVLSGLPDGVTFITLGLDGHTLFGATSDRTLNSDDHVYAYDLTTGTSRALGAVPGEIAGVRQMTGGDLAVLSSKVHSPFGTWLTRIDQSTGAPIASAQIPASGVSSQLEPGDDGSYYFSAVTVASTSPLTLVQHIERLDPGCFCVSSVYDYVVNANQIQTLTGLREGHIYVRALGAGVTRLTVTAGSPVQVDPYSSLQPYSLDLLPSGRLVMYSLLDNSALDPAYIVDTATFNPATDTPVVIESGSAPDGRLDFPTAITGAAGGQLYAPSLEGIYRIDPIAHTHTLVASLPQPMGLWPFVTARDGKLYTTTQDAGAIIRFDPVTCSVDTLRSFTFDPDTFMPGPDGAFPGPLTLGRDGWLYGAMQESNTDPFWLPGSLFKFDPTTGAFVTLHNFQADTEGASPATALVEGADGVWYGSDFNINTFTDAIFKFDTNTSTFTLIHTFDPGADGGTPVFFGVRPDGALLLTTFGGLVVPGDFTSPSIDTTIFTLDPNTDALAPLHEFLSTPNDIAPSSHIAIAPDGYGYFTLREFVQIFDQRTSLARVDLHSGAVTSIVALDPPFDVIAPVDLAPTIGTDGRIYGMGTASNVFAVGVLDPLPVAPAAGPFGGTTTLSATMKTLGVPVHGRTIAFTLNGQNVGTAVTNAQGVATLDNVSLFGIAVGSYPAAAGASFAGDAQFPATSGTGSLTVLDVPTPGLMIGDGFIRDGRSTYEFAFLVRETADGTDRGTLVLSVRPADHTFISTSYTNVVFSDDPTSRPGRANRPQVDTVSFAGTGTWDGHAGYRFEAFAQDRGEPGRHREAFSITVYDSADHVVANANGDLDGGNVQSVRIHR